MQAAKLRQPEMAAPMPPPQPQRGEPFFAWLAFVSLVVVLTGFASSYFLRAAHRPPLSSMLSWHGAALTAWFVLVLVQSALLAGHRSKTTFRLHLRLGMLSLFLALAVVVSGAMVAFDFYHHGTGDPILSPAGLLTANLLNLFSFGYYFVAGMLCRKHAELHKRFLSLCGIVMISPAAFRLVVHLGLPPPCSLVIQFGLCAALIVYDRRRLQRISKASWTGVLLIVWMIAVTLMVG